MSRTAQDILHEVAGILDERGRAYGDGQNVERNMDHIVAAFNAVTGRNLTEAEGWLFMVVLKAVRAGRGGNPGLDTFKDMAGYAALAGERYLKS